MYLSLPVSFTEPSRLAALGALYGIEAPPPDRARLLELGCASGGNIIPLAVRYPAMHITGVDLDSEAIESGQARIQALGLGNIALYGIDITAVPPEGESFDFIICHGVYSWTPPAVRAAILKLCERRLAPNGLAVISFNVLPGWRTQQIIRDICLSQSEPNDPAAERVSKARAFLQSLSGKLTDATPYGLAVRQAAKRLALRPDSYILGEFLAPINDAFFFDAFAAEAARSGLHYVCDGEFAMPNTEISESALDVVTGRTFRRAVLTKMEGAAFNPTHQALAALHVRCSLHPASSGQGGFTTAQGNPVQFRDDAVAAAVDRLIDAYPATLPLSEIVGADAASLTHVANAMLTLANARQAELRALPLDVGRSGDRRPRVFSLAQAEAASGRKWVSSLAHRAVPVGAETMHLLGLMDGSRDIEALRDAFLAHYPEGGERYVAIIHALEREALLEPGSNGAA